MTIRWDRVKDYRAVLADRGRSRSVVAHWQDQEKGNQVSERIGEGEPIFVLRHTYPDAEQAKSAARSHLDQFARGRSVVRLTLAGSFLPRSDRQR